MRIPALTGATWVRAAELEVWSALRNDAGAAFQAAFTRGVPPIATALLVGVQIRLWWMLWIPEFYGRAEAWLPKLTTSILENGETWRLFTMGFYHVAPQHLGMNLLWLAYSGWTLERALGRANLMALYLASVLGGSLFSMYGSPDRPAIGASGGVYGLIAAVTVFGLLRPELLTDRSRRLVGVAILPYLVVMFASGLQTETTDNWAHFGGLVTGGICGALLDPPGLQRRAHWNAALRAAIAGLCVGIPLALAAMGTRLQPLRDSERVADAFSRVALPPSAEGYRAVRYRVPVGWAPGTLSTGDIGVGSTAGPRAVAIVETLGEKPVTSDEVLEAWLTRVRDTGWPAAEAGPRRDTTLADRPARQVEVVLAGAQPPRVAIVTSATRGAWSLTAVWEVERASRARLASLEERVLASLSWVDPAPLVTARVAAGRADASRAQQIEYARQRVLAGEVADGLATLASLTAEAPREADAWLARIELASWDPIGADEVFDGALVARPEPKLITAISAALVREGRAADAAGLLEIAWLRLPGDRALARARRGLALPTGLEEGQPAELLRVGTQTRSDEEIAEWRAWPLTLGGASAAGAVLARERAVSIGEIAAALALGVEPAIEPLLTMKYGPVSAFPLDARQGLAEDVRSARAAIFATWVPDDLQPILSTDPGLQAWAEAVAAEAPGG